ncbi:MAG: nucleotidyltransferase [Acidobacteriota bacterium]
MAEIELGLKLFADFGVDCVVIGGVAAGAHGSSQATFDVDICYARDHANLTRLVRALESVNATLRGAPDNLPFILDEETIAHGLNFIFETDIGKIDILGEVQGVGWYSDCFEHSDEIEIFGLRFRVLSLEKLIAAKRFAGRAKDLLVLPELEALLEYQRVAEGDAHKLESE